MLVPSVRRLVILSIAALSLLTGCAAPPATAPPTPATDCITGFDPYLDDFPAKVHLDYARNVSVRYAPSYQVLTVAQPYPGGAPQSYVLLRCGAPPPRLPAELAAAPVIRVPVRSLYAASTTQLPGLVEVGGLAALTGVASPDSVSTPEVVARIRSGAVRAFSGAGQLDAEQVVAAAPDVVLGPGMDDPAYQAVRAGGVPVLQWSNYLDASPLGEAEWIKVLGALTGREVQAAATFDAVAARYPAAGRPGARAARRPGPGRSAVPGQLVGPRRRRHGRRAAAGCRRALVRGRLDQYREPAPRPRVGVGRRRAGPDLARRRAVARPCADVLAADPRFGSFAALGPGGQVWARDARLGPGGGNDIFERGVAHPDEVLGDLVAILHPDLEPGHRFVYYRRVTG